MIIRQQNNHTEVIMAKEKLTNAVYDAALPLAKAKGLDIYDVQYKKEGADRVLRVILDTPEDAADGARVSIDDCEAVSRALSDILDETDIVKEAYLLEVASPGLDRPLKKEKDFERFAGQSIDIGLYKAKNGSKVITGILNGYNNGDVTVQTDGGDEITVPKADIASVRLTVVF